MRLLLGTVEMPCDIETINVMLFNMNLISLINKNSESGLGINAERSEK